MQITLNEKESAEYIDFLKSKRKREKEMYKTYNELVAFLQKHFVFVSTFDPIVSNEPFPKAIIVKDNDFIELLNKYLRPFYYEDLEVLKDEI